MAPETVDQLTVMLLDDVVVTVMFVGVFGVVPEPLELEPGSGPGSSVQAVKNRKAVKVSMNGNGKVVL